MITTAQDKEKKGRIHWGEVYKKAAEAAPMIAANQAVMSVGNSGMSGGGEGTGTENLPSFTLADIGAEGRKFANRDEYESYVTPLFAEKVMTVAQSDPKMQADYQRYKDEGLDDNTILALMANYPHWEDYSKTLAPNPKLTMSGQIPGNNSRKVYDEPTYRKAAKGKLVKDQGYGKGNDKPVYAYGGSFADDVMKVAGQSHEQGGVPVDIGADGTTDFEMEGNEVIDPVGQRIFSARTGPVGSDLTYAELAERAKTDQERDQIFQDQENNKPRTLSGTYQPPKATPSKSQMLELGRYSTKPQPVAYDEARAERARRLAKANALGQGLAGIFNAALVAGGQDIAPMDNTAGNFAASKLAEIEEEYFKRMAADRDRVLWGEQQNVGLGNQEAMQNWQAGRQDAQAAQQREYQLADEEARRAFNAGEAEKQRDFQGKEGAKNRALQNEEFEWRKQVSQMEKPSKETMSALVATMIQSDIARLRQQIANGEGDPEALQNEIKDLQKIEADSGSSGYVGYSSRAQGIIERQRYFATKISAEKKATPQDIKTMTEDYMAAGLAKEEAQQQVYEDIISLGVDPKSLEGPATQEAPSDINPIAAVNREFDEAPAREQEAIDRTVSEKTREIQSSLAKLIKEYNVPKGLRHQMETLQPESAVGLFKRYLQENVLRNAPPLKSDPVTGVIESNPRLGAEKAIYELDEALKDLKAQGK